MVGETPPPTFGLSPAVGLAHYLRDKGKAGAHTQATALILEALRAGLRFRKDIVGVLLRWLLLRVASPLPTEEGVGNSANKWHTL